MAAPSRPPRPRQAPGSAALGRRAEINEFSVAGCPEGGRWRCVRGRLMKVSRPEASGCGTGVPSAGMTTKHRAPRADEKQSRSRFLREGGLHAPEAANTPATGRRLWCPQCGGSPSPGLALLLPGKRARPGLVAF